MKYLYLAAVFVLSVSITSCKNDDIYSVNSFNGVDTVCVKQISIDSTTTLSETEGTIPTDPADTTYDDYCENQDFGHTATIKFDGDTAIVDGDISKMEYSVSGAHVTISSIKKTQVVLVGYSDNGSLKVDSTVEKKFKVSLNGLSLTNPHGAAINCQSSKRMYLELSGTNTLCDGTTYIYTTRADGVVEDMKGTIFSEGKILFNGNGKLNVYAKGVDKSGISSDDYIRLRVGSNIYVHSLTGSGIKAKDGLFIGGGILNIEVEGNGCKGLNCGNCIHIDGGRTTVITYGASRITAGTSLTSADTSSCAALKCDTVVKKSTGEILQGGIIISGGIVNLKSVGEGGKGINCSRDVSMAGGELNVVTIGQKLLSSPRGISSDRNIIYSGGCLYSYSAHAKPLHALMKVKISSASAKSFGSYLYPGLFTLSDK